MHLGVRRCALPPNPPPACFNLRLPPLKATPRPRTIRRPTMQQQQQQQQQQQPRTNKKQPTTNRQQATMHLGGRRCALPPNPLHFFILRLPPLMATLRPRTIRRPKMQLHLQQQQQQQCANLFLLAPDRHVVGMEHRCGEARPKQQKTDRCDLDSCKQ